MGSGLMPQINELYIYRSYLDWPNIISAKVKFRL